MTRIGPRHSRGSRSTRIKTASGEAKRPHPAWIGHRRRPGAGPHVHDDPEPATAKHRPPPTREQRRSSSSRQCGGICRRGSSERGPRAEPVENGNSRGVQHRTRYGPPGDSGDFRCGSLAPLPSNDEIRGADRVKPLFRAGSDAASSHRCTRLCKAAEPSVCDH